MSKFELLNTFKHGVILVLTIDSTRNCFFSRKGAKERKEFFINNARASRSYARWPTEFNTMLASAKEWVVCDERVKGHISYTSKSSGVCASLLLLLEYVTFWLN